METENPEENEQEVCEPCEYEQKLEAIKYGIIAKIFEAGIRFEDYDLKSRDAKFKLPHDKHIELQTRMSVILDTYKDVVDLIWDESSDVSICNECQQNIEDNSDELSEELKNKLKDINPN